MPRPAGVASSLPGAYRCSGSIPRPPATCSPSSTGGNRPPGPPRPNRGDPSPRTPAADRGEPSPRPPAADRGEPSPRTPAADRGEPSPRTPAAEDPAAISTGQSIPYLAAIARFAAALTERGRVLPVLAAEDGGYCARWRPVLTGSDLERARDLAAAMPPLCRAAVADNPQADNPRADDPAALFTAALSALTDAAVRTRLPAPLLPPRRGRAPARISISERFVVSLTAIDARIQVATPQDEAEARDLAAELATWLDSARMPAGPVRTCFRLTEPV